MSRRSSRSRRPRPHRGASGARRRPRRPVQPADRAARARGARLLGARRTPALGCRGRRAQPGRARSSRAGRPPSTPKARRSSTRGSSSSGSRRSASATACSSWRATWVERSSALVRPSSARPSSTRAESELFHDLPPEQTVWMSHRDSVDRSSDRGGGHRLFALDTDRCVRGSRAAALRRAVPPRGRAHAARAGDPQELPLRGRGRAAYMDARGGDRGAGRAYPRGGRLRARSLRPLGRRRLGSCRAPRAQGSRRPAHLRVRRPRPPARERGGAGRRDVRRPLPRAARARASAEALPHAARRRLRPGGEAQDRRRGVHPRLRGGGRESSATSASSSRGRSTRT